jgi:hypothetical protein
VGEEQVLKVLRVRLVLQGLLEQPALRGHKALKVPQEQRALLVPLAPQGAGVET